MGTRPYGDEAVRGDLLVQDPALRCGQLGRTHTLGEGTL